MIDQKRYNGGYRAALDEPDDEPETPPVVQPQEQEPTNSEEVTFKKRYGDLRRYAAAEKTTWEGKEAEYKRQIAELATNTFRLPKNEQELSAFYKQYPDGAAFIETIAAKIADRKVSELGEKYDTQLTELQKVNQQTVKQRAYNELLKLHSDFEEIIADKKFQEWIDKQPQSIQDSLFKNDTDPEWAARSIDLYKLETEKAIVRKVNKNTPDKAAAAHVASTNVASEPLLSGDGKKIWKESEIGKLKPKEYDLLDTEITIAYREGRVMNDLTPPRRR